MLSDIYRFVKKKTQHNVFYYRLNTIYWF